MMPAPAAYLDIVRTDQPQLIWRIVALAGPSTLIGRLEAGSPGVDLAEAHISRQHAAIVAPQPGQLVWTLKNVQGRGGVRLYEHLLQEGESVPILHGYTFHIPGAIFAPDLVQFRITLRLNDQTAFLNLQPLQPPYFTIFGRVVALTPQQYTLLAYLYVHSDELCPYADLMAALWPHEAYDAGRKRSLEPIVAELRKVIRQASGGVALIETLWSEGLCLRS